MRRVLFLFAFVAFFFLLGLALAGAWLRSELERPYYGGPAGGAFVDIPRGANTGRIADLLIKSGILRYRMPFMLYLRCLDMGRRIQAGEYMFSEPSTPRQVAQRLIRGDVYFRSITIPEGLTARETMELLAKDGLGNLEEMQKALLKTDWIRDLDPGARNLEGYLFPETYRFSRRIGSEAIVKTMVNQFRTEFAGIQAQTPERSGLSVSQIVILASMIEKEVKRPEEGPLVASVLVNRLERKIPLGCDATIIYAMKLAGIYRGNLGKADMKMESPYNSYIHLGLPPGPIANPGALSIRAALNPAKTDYLYYVSRNDGTHQFSRDFRSHLNAVDRFQRSLAGGRASGRKSGN